MSNAYDRLTLLERMAIICACGECGVDPATWECESKDNEADKAEARRVLAILHADADARRAAKAAKGGVQ